MAQFALSSFSPTAKYGDILDAFHVRYADIITFELIFELIEIKLASLRMGSKGPDQQVPQEWPQGLLKEKLATLFRTLVISLRALFQSSM